MRFTYGAYKDMLIKLREQGYVFSDYSSWKEIKKAVILRHDVDFDIPAAVRMAEIEHSMGISSTYFFLLSSDFYNIHSFKDLLTILLIFPLLLLDCKFLYKEVLFSF